ncbi:YeiH family protein [Rubripirellula amarantea]|nr:YeiH family protein [Rubripirellula amarantea]
MSRKNISDDWLAIICATFILIGSLACVVVSTTSAASETGEVAVSAVNPLAQWIGKPAKWSSSPLGAFSKTDDSGALSWGPLWATLGSFALLSGLLSLAIRFRDGRGSGVRFLRAFAGVFLLATFSYALAEQSVVKAYNLEYALWALMVGLIISNTIGTPSWLRPAVLTEFFIKTGLVLLGAEVLMSRLLALGLPGICVAWIVTPIVLISTYIFGQKVLKIESRSLNMVISADMSVCGVSAAIAAAAACKAKKEELSLAIGMSLSFTVVMMVVMPLVIKAIGLDDVVAGAWMGGTIDSTGAVAAAGATLGDRALEVAATVKMIQNILIGVSAFGIASYWVAYVEKDAEGTRPGISEVWKRFPRFVLGFVAASIIFSLLHSFMEGGPEIVGSMIKGSTKTLRGWLFCLAFVSIGLETKFSELTPYFRGGKPLLLYLAGQSLNLILTLLMAYLMFGILFRDFIAQ